MVILYKFITNIKIRHFYLFVKFYFIPISQLAFNQFVRAKNEAN